MTATPTDQHTLAAGRYRLLQPLGEGGMATVFRAVDTEVGDGGNAMRAIKVLRGKWAGRKKTRQRLENEAAVMMGLPHPHVVQVHGLYSAEAEVFIIMELLPGGSVWDVVMAHGRLPARVSADVCCEVLEALALAHDNGIIHRDIKPHNVLLTLDGHAKVTDFGIARIEDSGMTRTGVVMGTLAYMPPEQKLSARKVDARADLYAVGAMLWACVTGREPHDLYAAGMDDALADEYFAEVPDPLRAVILQATRFAPEARYADARAMQGALEQARDALPTDHQALTELIDIDRAHKLRDAAATVITDEVQPKAPSTYPGESAALTPILPPRRGEGAIVPMSGVAQLPEATTSSPAGSRTAFAGGIVALGLAAGLGVGGLGAAAFAWFWVVDDPDVAQVELPAGPEPVAAQVEAASAPVEAAPQAPNTPEAPAAPRPTPAAAPPPAPAPDEADGVAAVAPTPQPVDAVEAPAPEVHVVEVPAPEVRVVEAPAPDIRVTEVAPAPAPPPVAPAPLPAPAPAPVQAGGWEATSMPGAGGRVTVVLTLKADRTVTTGAGSTGHPKLVLVCAGKKGRVFFDPGIATEMVVSETGMDASFAKVAINGEIARMYLAKSGAQTALAMGRKWIPQMRGGGRWTVDFVPSGASSTQVSFALSGLDALMTERFDPHCKR